MFDSQQADFHSKIAMGLGYFEPCTHIHTCGIPIRARIITNVLFWACSPSPKCLRESSLQMIRIACA